MKMYKFLGYAILLASFVSCGTKNNADTNVTQCETALSQSEPAIQDNNDAELITHVYDTFVFATDTDGNDDPADYFTANALKRLQDDYEFDCEDGACYAYYALRTQEQDSKPGSEDVSQICSIEPTEDGWYVVSYLDMGWPGMTRVKIADGKIDDYGRCAERKYPYL